MYAVYNYPSSGTMTTLATNVQADLVKILTDNTGTVTSGLSNLSTLTGACITSSSSVNTTASNAGWSVYDTAPTSPSTGVVLRAQSSDYATSGGYNYILIYIDTSGYINLYIYESWTLGTHTGTNQCNQGGAMTIRLSSAGGTLYISAKSGSSCIINGFSSSWGNSYGFPVGVIEHTRRSPWDTATTSPVFSPLALLSASTGVWGSTTYIPRLLSATGVDVVGSASAYVSTIWGTSQFNNTSVLMPSTTIPNAAKQPQHILAPILISNLNYGYMGGDCSYLSDVWFTTNTYGTGNETVQVAGNTYTIWPIGGTMANRLAVRLG